MFQSFFTGYFQEGVKVMDPRPGGTASALVAFRGSRCDRRIVRNYLKSWFWLDLLVVGWARISA